MAAAGNEASEGDGISDCGDGPEGRFGQYPLSASGGRRASGNRAGDRGGGTGRGYHC